MKYLALISVLEVLFLVFVQIQAQIEPLFKDAIPEEYNLQYNFEDVEKGTFSIDERIRMLVIRKFENFTLHTKNFNIGRVILTPFGGSIGYSLGARIFDEETETVQLMIDFNKMIQSAVGFELRIIATGRISDHDLEGIFRRTLSVSGRTQNYYVTNFNPIFARSAFICFDEPEPRATIRAQVRVDSQYRVFSNVAGEKNGLITQFPNTPELSPRSFSLFLSRFDSLKTTPGSSGIAREFQVQESIKRNLNFALNEFNKIYESMEDYFQMTFPISKIDLIAVPELGERFLSDYGLINFDEYGVYFETDWSPEVKRISIISTMAGAIAQQIFGNVITPEWWDSVWTTEGIVKYLEYHGLSNNYENFELEKKFFADNVLKTMRTTLSRTIETTVSTNSDIINIFDDSLLIRTASIYRMISNLIGYESFNDALRDFVTENNFTSFHSRDFYRHLQESAEKNGIYLDVTAIMDSWISKETIPILIVNRLYDEYGSIQLVQTDGLDGSKPRWLPFKVRSKSIEPAQKISWIVNDNFDITVPQLSRDEWIVFNENAMGLYRVNYDNVNWNLITKQLLMDFTVFSDTTRAQMLDDSMQLAKLFDYLSYDVALDLLTYTEKEHEYVPWKAAVDNLKPLSWLMYRTSVYNDFTIVMQDLANNYLNELGFLDYLNERLSRKIARSMMIDWACGIGHFTCLSVTKTFFQSFVDTKANTISPDLKATTICNGLRSSTLKEFDYVFEKLKVSRNIEERLSLIDGLGCFEDKTALTGFLEYSLEIQGSEQLRAIQSVYKGTILGYQTVQVFLQKNHEKIALSNWPMIVEEMSERITSQEDFEQFEKLLEFVGINDTEKQRALSRIRSNLDWLNSDSPATIADWLEKRLNPTLRLPGYFKIVENLLNYNETNVEDGTFILVQDIKVEIQKSTNRIVLHGRNLEILYRSVFSETGTPIDTIGDPVYDAESETFTLNLKEIVNPGEYLDFMFIVKGNISNDSTQGIFKKSYRNGDHDDFILLSNFQPINARSAFLCVDEPNTRMSIELFVTQPNYFTVTSNTPIMNIDGSEMLLVSFEPTPPIYSGSLAISASRFNVMSTKDLDIPSKIPQFMHARNSSLDSLAYALQESVEIYDAVEKYFGISLPLDKLDFTAVPDFEYSQLSSFGHVVLNEFPLVFDQQYSPEVKKVAIINTLAHATVDQIYGNNIITPTWWNSVWILRGISKLTSYFSIFEKFKWFDYDKFFFLDNVLETLKVFDLHPIKREIENMSAIHTIYNEKEMVRASCIFNMISNTMGQENFQRTLQNLTKSNEFSSISMTELAISFNETFDNIDFTTFLESWVEQPELPVLKVTRNYVENKIKISNSNGNKQWIPYNYMAAFSEGKASPISWLEPSSSEFSLTVPWLKYTDWIVFNVNAMGLYRVNYDPDNWRLITKQLSINHQVLSDVTRAQLIDDSMTFAKSQQLSYDTALDLISYVANDVDYLPWKVAIDQWRQLSWLMYNTPAYGDFTLVMQNQIKNYMKHLNFDDMEISHFILDRFARTMAINWACEMGAPDCLEETVTALQSYLNKLDPLSKNLKSAVICSGLRSASNPEFMALLLSLISNQIPDDRMAIIAGLGCSKYDGGLKDFLEFSLTISIPEQLAVLKSVIEGNVEGYKLVLEFLNNRHQEVSPNNLPEVLREISRRITDEDHFNQLSKLMSNQLEIDYSDANTILKPGRDNIRWLEGNSKEMVTKWLARKLEIDDSFRLPGDLIPLEYILNINDTNVEDMTFTAIELIKIKAVKETTRIILHARDLKVVNMMLIRNDKRQFIVSKEYDENKEIVVIPVDKPIVANEIFEIMMLLESKINNGKSEGFYMKTYEENGKSKNLFLTNFHPTSARSVLLCFDEPEFRAPLELTMTHDSDSVIIANMDLMEDNGSGNIISSFNPTPELSTKNLAFAITTMDNSSTRSDDVVGKTIHQFYMRSEFQDSSNFTITQSPKVYDLIKNYFAVDLKQPKLDSILVPEFDQKSLSDYGFIKYDEFSALFDPLMSPDMKQADILRIFSKAITQQVFGNYLTPKWWDSAWILEGVSKLAEYFVIANEYPEFHLEKLFYDENVRKSLKTSLAVPIKFNVVTAADIANVFNEDSIVRASNILRMIKNVIGDDRFQTILKNLTANSFSTITLEDFYELLDSKDSINLGAVIESWIDKVNIPILQVTRNYETSGMKLQQFERNPLDNSVPRTIPFNYQYQGSEVQTNIEWLNEGQSSFSVDQLTPNSWIIFNVDSFGPYRVNYDHDNWRLITKQLRTDQNAFSDTTRAQLIDDSLAFSKVSLLDYPAALDLLISIEDDYEYLPWKAAVDNLRPLSWLMFNTPAYENFTIVFQRLAIYYMNFLTYDDVADEPFLNKFARPLLIDWLCELNSKDCLKTTNDMLNDFVGSKNTIPRNIKSSIICNGLKSATSSSFEALKKLMEVTQSQDEKFAIIDGLGCYPTVKSLKELLQDSLEKSSAEQLRLIQSVIKGSMEGYKLVLEFLTENYFSIETNNLPVILEDLSVRIMSKSFYEKLETLLVMSGVNSHVRDVSLSNAMINLNWLSSKFQSIISDWLMEQIGGDNDPTSTSKPEFSLVALASQFINPDF